MTKTNSNRIEYKPHQLIGEYGCRYLEELEPQILKKKGKRRQYIRKALFQCGICSQSFTRGLDSVKSGNVKSCGCLKKYLFDRHLTKDDYLVFQEPHLT
jgi:hypothetical protein